MTEHDPLLDIKQAAKFLSVSETSLRRWTNEGILPCLRVGRRRERRFRRADLLAFLESAPVIPAGSEGAAEPSREADEADGMAGLHLCHIYTTDADRSRLVTDFLRRGLSRGAQCFFLARRPVYDAVIAQLRRELGTPSSDAIRVAHLDYKNSVEAQFAALESEFRTARRSGAPAIYSVGDPPQLPPSYSLEEVVANEFGYDRIAHRYHVTTMCLYDARKFTSMQLVAAMRGHRDMLDRPLAMLLG